MTLCAALSHPPSRGSVHILSADLVERPTIDPRYLSHHLDHELLARHVQYIETIVQTELLASLLKKNCGHILKKKRVRELNAARSLGPETVMSHFHSTGTCTMMP